MFVQYPHFQLSPVPRSDVENNATRNRRRKHCGKVEADDELGFRRLTSSSTAQSSSASSRPVILRAQSAGKLAAGGSNRNDAASGSQLRQSGLSSKCGETCG